MSNSIITATATAVPRIAVAGSCCSTLLMPSKLSPISFSCNFFSHLTSNSSCHESSPAMLRHNTNTSLISNCSSVSVSAPRNTKCFRLPQSSLHTGSSPLASFAVRSFASAPSAALASKSSSSSPPFPPNFSSSSSSSTSSTSTSSASSSSSSSSSSSAQRFPSLDSDEIAEFDRLINGEDLVLAREAYVTRQIARAESGEQIFKFPSAEERRRRAEHLYLFNPNISEHTEQHINRFFPVDPEFLKYSPTESKFPLSIHWSMEFEIHYTGGFMMIRKDAWQLVQKLKNIQNRKNEKINNNKNSQEKISSSQGRIIGLKGDRGTGKSACLHYAVQYAKQNGWLILPTKGIEFMTETKGNIRPTDNKEKSSHVFEQPRYTALYLSEVYRQNSSVLSLITCKQSKKHYESLKIDWNFFSGKNLNLEKFTLAELVEIGTKSETVSCIIMDEFMKEIKNFHTEVPVLLAIDDINDWWSPSSFIEPKKYSRIPGFALSLPDHFLSFLRNPPSNGCTIFATRANAKQSPLQHLFHPIVENLEIKIYNDQELWQHLNHYFISGFLFTPITESFFHRTKAMTGAIPREVYSFAAMI